MLVFIVNYDKEFVIKQIAGLYTLEMTAQWSVLCINNLRWIFRCGVAFLDRKSSNLDHGPWLTLDGDPTH